MARGQGRVFQPKGSLNWSIEYWVRGQQRREASRSPKKSDAVALLKRRQGEAATGRLVSPHVERTTFEELSAMLVQDYQVNGRKSLDRARRSLHHLAGSFAGVRALDITSDVVTAYIAGRLTGPSPARPATIRNELAALTRMFTLGFRAGKVPSRPAFPSIAVHNTRSGFFEEEELSAVLNHLPEALRAVVQFTYLTGWRIGEVRQLTWRQVDLKADVVRLEPGETKNREGRVYPFSSSPELKALLLEQRRITSLLEREVGGLVPWVFHRQGKPIRNFHMAWRNACRKAGYPGRLVHDLRRTAVREMERAGVPRSVAMKLSGHKTESIYRRYAIVSEADLAEGVGRRASFRERTRIVPAQSAGLAGGGDDEPSA